MYRSLRFTLLVVASLLLAGCGQILVGIEDPEGVNQPGAESTGVAPLTPGVPDPMPTETVTPTSEPSPYWDVIEDPRTGLRFAIPCFWRADIPMPEQDPTGLGAFAVRNFGDEYAMSFPRSAIPEDAGAVKIDMLFWETTDFGASPGADLSELEIGEFFAGSESEIIDTERVEVNGQPAMRIVTESTFGVSELVLMRLGDELVFGFAPGFTVDHPDVEGVLNSIALDPSTAVKVPSERPAPPPVGLAAPCIPEYAVAVEPTQALGEENTTCGVYSYRSLGFLTTKVQEYLQNRNTGGLIHEYLVNDPFIIGYWLSEGVTLGPNEAGTTFANSLLYQAGEPGDMTFTSDRDAFPALEGTPLENMFGPDVDVAEIIYSEGWGTDGRGAALLFFAQDECGGYYWPGLVFSADAFGR